MSHPHRVVITGLGQVSCLGVDVRSFFERACAGESGIGPLADLNAPGLEQPIGAAVPSWDPLAWQTPRGVQMSGRMSQFALAASTMALTAAGLDRSERPRAGIHVGSGFGGLSTIEETYRACYSTPGTRPKPSAIPMSMANAASGLLATELRLTGPNLTICTACSSSTHAIGQAFHMLRRGEVDLMLAGGADTPLTTVVMAAWNVMRVLAPAGNDPSRACRPFHQDRQGLVIGEGAGFVVLETLAHATARKAPILAEVLGYGRNADGGHITRPDQEGMRGAMALALEDAELVPDEVDYVNAHGTGTQVNDQTEAAALTELFGARSPELLVSSMKGVHGHAMGASGALGVIATVMTFLEGRVPPTANLTVVDPALPRLDLVVGEPRKANVRVAIASAFGFGGNNAVLALRRI